MRAIPVVLLAAIAPIAVAEEMAVSAADACRAVEADSERLACYDNAFGRSADSAQVADAAAEQARQAKEDIEAYERFRRQSLPPAERARETLGELFRAEDGPDALEARIANAGKGGLLDSRWELARDSKLGVFNFRAYKPVYLLPAFYTTDVNTTPQSPNPDNTVTTPQALGDVEAKFQISFKTKALENLFGDNGDVWMAYTQSSRWQVYNGDNSRPFRETNYEPEVLLVFRNGYRLGGWHGRMASIGINHQSNGRSDPFSRSWNRVIGTVALDRENWALTLRPWWRVPDGSEDDNPDIENYMGRGDLTLVHTRGGHELALMARHSLRGGEDSRGALQFDWGFPINRTLRGHVQVFDGYGESLIDYNHRATYVGLGISLMEWF